VLRCAESNRTREASKAESGLVVASRMANWRAKTRSTLPVTAFSSGGAQGQLREAIAFAATAINAINVSRLATRCVGS
jgi:hypothetical protein